MIVSRLCADEVAPGQVGTVLGNPAAAWKLSMPPSSLPVVFCCLDDTEYFPMDDQITSLRQQVKAADFLLRNLKAQLQEAEKQRASNSTDNSNEQGGSHSSRRAAARTCGNIDTHPPGSRSDNDDINRHHDQHEASNQVQSAIEDDDVALDQDADFEAISNNNLDPSFTLPSIDAGTLYPSLEHVKTAVIAHAVSQGWTCRVYKRDRTRILLRCRTDVNCPFHLRAEQYRDGAKICASKLEHKCSFQPDQSHISRSHVSSLKFLRQELPNVMDLTPSTTSQEISDVVFQRFGTRINVKQCRELRPGPRRKRTPAVATCGLCGAVGHNRKTCGRTEAASQIEME